MPLNIIQSIMSGDHWLWCNVWNKHFTYGNC